MVRHGKKGLLVWVLQCILNVRVIRVSDFSHITQIAVLLKELNMFLNCLQNLALHVVYSIFLLSFFRAAGLLEHLSPLLLLYHTSHIYQ